MSDKKLAVLGLVAAVMVVLAVAISAMSNRVKKTTQVERPLIQGLDTKVIARIELGAGEKHANLILQGKQFVLADMDNYPALTSKVNELIGNCLDIKVAEMVTDNPENHADLEVDIDIKGKEDRVTKNIVRFYDKDDKLITGLIIGKRDPQAGGSYVRQISDDNKVSNQVYVSPNVKWLQMTGLNYAEKKLFMVDKENIARVTVSHGQRSYTIKSDQEGNAALENIPEGKQAKGTEYNSVFSAATRLEMAGVQQESAETKNLDFNITYVVELKDSTICTFKMAQEGDKTYAVCQSSFGDMKGLQEIQKKINQTMSTGQQTESDEKIEENDAKIKAYQASGDFTKKHTGWVYEIPSWQAGNLTKKLDELIEDVPVEEKPKAGADAGEAKPE
ncbi:MAG: DUF4340 domain-containing protein [Phycisphaerae bacterium]|nr:DUF4340 domain-containing protein [Phycisphaerae bacterium]